MSTKKKIIGAVILLLSAAAVVSVVLFNSELKGTPLPSLLKDQKQVEEILSSRTETDRRIESAVRFDGIELPYDRQSGTYYYSVPENTRSAFTPNVSVSSGEKVRIVFSGDGITDEKIAGGVPLEAVVYTNSEYHRIRIVCTTLPIISITSNSEIERDVYVKMRIKIFDNRSEATSRLTVSSGKIHTRGNSSRNFDKKAYRITLQDMSLGQNRRELDISLLGMRKDGDWILYAAYNDQERIRNVFSTNLWNESCGKNNSLGVQNGVEYRFTELFINDEYLGLYALGYPLDKKQLEITDGEYTFQKSTWAKELTIDYSDYNALAENYEIQQGDEYADGQTIWGNLGECYRALQQFDGSEDRISGLFDTDNAIDVFLFLNFVQGVDNVDNWTTLNLDQTVKLKDGSPVLLYTPWDMDQTFGNIWDPNSKNWIAPYGFKAESNRLMKVNPAYMSMMFGNEDTLRRVKKRYEQLRAGAWSEESLNRAIDEYEKQIFASGAYLRDAEKWPDSTTLDDPSEGLSRFREHVTERLNYMDRYIAQLSVEGLYEDYDVLR